MPAAGAPRRRPFEALPASRTEVEQIRGLWSGDVAVLLGAEATEATVRSLAVGKRLIHLATHGEAGASSPSSLPRGRKAGWLGAGAERRIDTVDPRLRSLVALAGANARAGVGDDDGLLTAIEAAQLDLAGTELVVLSACDTAGGQIESGEGVIGLVQAFRTAGARNVVASLWKVDDDATGWLMRRFHEELARGEGAPGPAEALRRAARALRTAKPDGKDRSAPFYWAAFGVYGPPR